MYASNKTMFMLKTDEKKCFKTLKYEKPASNPRWGEIVVIPADRKQFCVN